MSAFEALLGPSLLSRDGPTETAAALQDAKVVGLYFSAHSCPPCREFTPKLAEWFVRDLESKGMRIVFVSDDSDVAEFDEYFAEMPWLAVPYSNEGVRKELEQRYSVESIPALVLLRPTPGTSDVELLSAQGRGILAGDSQGMFFPWAQDDLDRQRIACDQLFDYCDKDKDGFLNFEEAATLARSTGSEIPRELFEGMCEELECDPTKGLDRDAFWCTYSEYGAGDVAKDLKTLGHSVEVIA